MSPFFANHRYNLEAYRQPRKDDTRAERATIVVEKLKELYSRIATDIKFQNQRLALYANKKRSIGPLLERGDKVYLLRKNIRTKRLCTKLDFKKLGLFEILDKVGKVNYRLQLLANSKLHLVFYISLLELVRGNLLIATDAEL